MSKLYKKILLTLAAVMLIIIFAHDVAGANGSSNEVNRCTPVFLFISAVV